MNLHGSEVNIGHSWLQHLSPGEFDGFHFIFKNSYLLLPVSLLFYVDPQCKITNAYKDCFCKSGTV